MDIQYHGANCVVLTTKDTRIVLDDNLAGLGGKAVTKNGDVLLYTGLHGVAAGEPKIVIDGPGEYEVSGVMITGIPARAHMDEEDKHTATMYVILAGDTRVLLTGHIYPKLDDNQLEAIGLVDAMIVPVGGNGYTLDPVGALKLIKTIEPKVVVPTHYDDKGLTYEVPQQTLEQAIHELGMEAKETTGKLKLRPNELSDSTQLVVIEKS